MNLDLPDLDLLSRPVGGVPISIAVDDIEPDLDQPRKNFDQEKLQELADSIRVHGVVQPISVH